LGEQPWCCPSLPSTSLPSDGTSGQLLKGEKKEDVIRLTQTIVKMARNLRDGFHSIIRVHEQPIAYHANRKMVR
jgi:hypothetical protein